MSENQKRGRGRLSKVEQEDAEAIDFLEEDPATIPVSQPSEMRMARSRLRERWELASVLNFLQVFQSIIRSGLEMSAEEIETALIMPNNALAQLHIALLKGIPPISKNLTGSDAWVTVLCKKLATWWSWVAEGEVPLVADRGAEIPRYRELDPTIRLLILKALCEIRADQGDILMYVGETLKQGAEVSTFRKYRIGGDENGTTYWYDGDSVLGHRLYREINKVEFKKRSKGRGSLMQPTINLQWETLATNLEEFCDISDKFSSSKIMAESAVGERIKSDIIPVLEKLQKKKERALKRQQTQAMLLQGFVNSQAFVGGRSLRDRRPVSYTYDDYDRSIEEAIQMEKKVKITDEQKDEGSLEEHGSSGEDVACDGTVPTNDNDNKYQRDGSESDDDDDDYDDKNDSDDDDGELGNSDAENDSHDDKMHSKQTERQKNRHPAVLLGVRRSKRTEASKNNDAADAVRQSPNCGTSYALIVSDTEDEN